MQTGAERRYERQRRVVHPAGATLAKPHSCESSTSGTSSRPGSAACPICPIAMFNDYEFSACAKFLSGFFGDVSGVNTDHVSRRAVFYVLGFSVLWDAATCGAMDEVARFTERMKIGVAKDSRSLLPSPCHTCWIGCWRSTRLPFTRLLGGRAAVGLPCPRSNWGQHCEAVSVLSELAGHRTHVEQVPSGTACGSVGLETSSPGTLELETCYPL